jgi:perosamine synthetase
MHEELGWNMRMTNLQAALGVAQLEKLDQFVARKRAMGKRYTELFSDLQEYVELPLEKTEYAENIYWVYGMVLKDQMSFGADVAMNKLGALGVGTRPFFYPMHKQPVFQKMGLFDGESYPVAERLAERGFYIPSGLALSEDQMRKVAERVKRMFDEHC